jgi:hypothetical protein
MKTEIDWEQFSGEDLAWIANKLKEKNQRDKILLANGHQDKLLEECIKRVETRQDDFFDGLLD